MAKDTPESIKKTVFEYEEELRANKLSEEAINNAIAKFVSENYPDDDQKHKDLMTPTFMESAHAAAEGQSQFEYPSIWTKDNNKEYNELLTKYSLKRINLEKIVTDQSFRKSGKGGFYNQFQNNLTRIDKFGHRIMNSTAELSGLTFITRPKLNLTTAMLKQDAQLIMLNTNNPNSIAFAMRMLLDSKLSKSDIYANYVNQSPLFDPTSPWMIPLMNNLTDISGFPDPTMDVFTSEGGFFNEQISFVAGSDRCRRTFELNLTFNDIQYGIVMALLQFWFEWMALLSQGVVAPYMEDIEQRIIPYTVSIYRFLFDPTRRYITRWAKCTGCFPRAVPVGAVFNISQGEVFSNSAAKFSVPFTCNVFEYNKPTIIQDFNALATRYCPNITRAPYLTAALEPESNFIGLPYIISTTKGMKMLWRFKPEENQNYPLEALNAYVAELAETSTQLNQMVEGRQQQIFRDMSINPNYNPSGANPIYAI